ncbi:MULTISPECIES: RNA polymerase Rpb4 family protein [Methanobacterium]|jgi:DNA-directed RNA polymerase subunit F|uniref:DNA-directed RNA polymerase subunit Rpo4 n=1 Tax=Methanobacterium bryantii TaxID=2161 RepID=A0A2A2H6G4_METBR|nr:MULTISPECIES: RNA polymerase Rpb4 family protein [Methanobacterium]OEC85930.1 DNA-directed RNA polymerase subunit F [Methanobacterium sp. A39]PAV04915.1 DNA-directed RNA polymerase subunit F [Methanobacterium bryantii]
MIGKKVIDTDPITISEVKEMLGELSEHYELTYEQNLALDHVTKFSKLDEEAAKKLVEELSEIIKKTQAIKVADIMPEDLADLRLIFAKERGSFKQEDMEKILEIVNNYR